VESEYSEVCHLGIYSSSPCCSFSSLTLTSCNSSTSLILLPITTAHAISVCYSLTSRCLVTVFPHSLNFPVDSQITYQHRQHRRHCSSVSVSNCCLANMQSLYSVMAVVYLLISWSLPPCNSIYSCHPYGQNSSATPKALCSWNCSSDIHDCNTGILMWENSEQSKFWKELTVTSFLKQVRLARTINKQLISFMIHFFV
jgi:hypothetical protein